MSSSTPGATSSFPQEATNASAIVEHFLRWYAANGRDLPMRRPDVSPWATLVFEVMSHQTPIHRVQPVWERWMELWPTPQALAAASGSQILVEWDRLGYPSRALRLRDCAEAIASRPGGEVPASYEALLALPGIGPYTASALASFQFHQRLAVLDTNVRRVISRVFCGRAGAPAGAPSRAEVAFATSLLPADGHIAARWNVAVMEFGALACTQRSPNCGTCPVRSDCAWAQAGFPADQVARRTQAWAGTDRQARGRVMAALRAAHSSANVDGADGSISFDEALAAATLEGAESGQAPRVVEALASDGLIQANDGRVTLPH